MTNNQQDAREGFLIGSRVRKRRGSSWHGTIVGTYSTALTPNGYAVESEREPGSVQIYPAAALESAPQQDAREGVMLDELDIMAERLGRCVPFGNHVDCHDVLGFALTGLEPGPARDAALADRLAHLGRPVDRQGDGVEALDAKSIVGDAITVARAAQGPHTIAPTPPADLVEAAQTYSRYHLQDEQKFEVTTAEGHILLGKGWLVISEEEYSALSAQAGAAPGVGELRPGLEEALRLVERHAISSATAHDRSVSAKQREIHEARSGLASTILAGLRARLASQPGGGPVAAGASDGELRKAARAVVVAYDRDEFAYKSPRLISALRAALGASSGGEGSRG